MRLQLFLLAYNLGNFLPQAVLPRSVQGAGCEVKSGCVQGNSIEKRPFGAAEMACTSGRWGEDHENDKNSPFAP